VLLNRIRSTRLRVGALMSVDVSATDAAWFREVLDTGPHLHEERNAHLDDDDGWVAALIAELVDTGFDESVARVASNGSFVPLGNAARIALVSEHVIEAAALEMVQR